VEGSICRVLVWHIDRLTAAIYACRSRSFGVVDSTRES
jgi:hypothetical protein